MDRRKLLTSAAAAVAATAVPGPQAAAQTAAAAPSERKNYVLVHGTWLGGWSWQRVRRILQAAGHEVHAPSLTGCGDRKHLMSRDIGLDTHITDVVNLIEYEELDQVILVGHSFAGITITGVADQMRGRIRRLVYFDALVPDGERMSGVKKDPDGALPEYWRKRQAKFIDGYQMDFFAEYPMKMLVPEGDEANAEWARRRITPHPARGWSEDLIVRNGGYTGLPKSYVLCTGQEFAQSSEFMYGPAKRQPGWDFIEFPYPRAPMMTHPEPTAELLLQMT
ncbi:MAG TPA: alpha/beta hydrolase [Steroidobacteraceae bacterium]|nr:alpha/beta hydrolase [Steroidobacteraceae bacterium]HRX88834.1 alpha/beta hydrolase [Steroidobacteraceae bacterium]